MANSGLTVSQLSHIALSAAIDHGFNCVQILGQYVLAEDCMRYQATFGEKEAITALGFPSWCECGALSYEDEVTCQRAQKSVLLPVGIEFETSDEIRRKIGAELIVLCST